MAAVTDVHGQVVVGGAVPEPVLAGATALYAAAFGAAPYHEPPANAAMFAERVRRYATEREGARLAWITDPSTGDQVAMALGVVGTPRTWWRDKVAAHLGERAAAEWLGERCFEVVHVAVDPGRRRLGLGRFVLDLLTAGAPAPTALLGCDPAVPAARALYLGAGYRILAADFTTGPGDTPHWIMGYRLRP
jgi:GNAT superfamily N-acetyltransferase